MKRKPQNESGAPQYFVKIDRNERQTVTREHDPNDRWSGEDTIADHTIHGFEVVEENRGWDFVLPYDPTGKTLYLVCAFYDTGDSFSRHENKLCLVSLQEHLEDAQTIVRACEADYRAYQDRGNCWDYKPLPVKLPVADKTEDVYTGTWKGYFERLRELRVETLGGGMSVKF